MTSSTIRTRITLTAAAALAAAAAFAPLAARAEGPVTKGNASFALASRYSWRGQTLSKGFVLQPTVGISYGGFSTNLWSNIDLDHKESETDKDSIAHTETDLTLSYTAPVGPVSLTGGYIYYGFDGANDTQELYVTAALATVLNPALTVYYDVDEGKGGFAILALSQAFPLSKTIALTAGGSLGLNLKDAAMGLDKNGNKFTGLYYGEVSLATSIPVYANVSIDPRIAYAFGIGDGTDAIASVSVDGKKSLFYGSVAATISF
jgi:hypothetical protein